LQKVLGGATVYENRQRTTQRRNLTVDLSALALASQCSQNSINIISVTGRLRKPQRPRLNMNS